VTNRAKTYRLAIPKRLAALLALMSLALSAYAALEIAPEVIATIEREYGPPAMRRIEQWQRMMEFAKDFQEDDKLKMVNDFFNRLTFVEDIKNWDVDDYWATPVEFLAKNGGDCEDFSIAKYFTLIAIGVPEDRLRMTYVKALGVNQSHMVLTYFTSARATPLVLDNLNPHILPASQREDLFPVYSFNGSGLWLAKSSGSGKQIEGVNRLGPWRDLQARMEKVFRDPVHAGGSGAMPAMSPRR
jgi:predicted transglutaminase-like cysteine proteinase